MDAICKADYDRRVEARSKAERERERKKKEGATAAAVGAIKVPEVGYHDIYGVWFHGKIEEVIVKLGRECFSEDLRPLMHVYVSLKPEKIADGTHDLSVYDYACRLYKWKAQGFHRGLVVLADDAEAAAEAETFLKSGTWSWRLGT